LFCDKCATKCRKEARAVSTAGIHWNISGTRRRRSHPAIRRPGLSTLRYPAPAPVAPPKSFLSMKVNKPMIALAVLFLSLLTAYFIFLSSPSQQAKQDHKQRSSWLPRLNNSSTRVICKGAGQVRQGHPAGRSMCSSFQQSGLIPSRPATTTRHCMISIWPYRSIPRTKPLISTGLPADYSRQVRGVPERLWQGIGARPRQYHRVYEPGYTYRFSGQFNEAVASIAS